MANLPEDHPSYLVCLSGESLQLLRRHRGSDPQESIAGGHQVLQAANVALRKEEF